MMICLEFGDIIKLNCIISIISWGYFADVTLLKNLIIKSQYKVETYLTK